METWILAAIFFFMAYAMLNILSDIRGELRQLRVSLEKSEFKGDEGDQDNAT